MKKIIAALLACAGITTANATVLMYAPAVSGGRIHLTDVSCARLTGYPDLQQLGKGFQASLTDKRGKLVDVGCWTFDNPDFLIVWSDFDVRRYSARGMTITDAARARAKALQ